jgi:hypothetical protein
MRIKGYDLMKAAAENPQQYEGKKYKVVGGACIGPSREMFWEVVVDANGRINGKNYENWAYFTDTCILEEIPPEPKPVSFMEAVKAYSEGKTIKCKLSRAITGDEEIVYNPSHHKSGLGYGYWIEDSLTRNISTEAILHGTWYIEEAK